LRQIVIDARKRPELSREEAAGAERLFIRVDQEFLRHRDGASTLHQFVEQYAGTEAALLTGVDILSDGRAT
jgi:hypothetical protein